LSGGVVLDVIAVLPIGIAMGAASWYLIEQPLMRRAGGVRRTTTPADHPRPPIRVARREAPAFRA
jgi:hypothetical protein